MMTINTYKSSWYKQPEHRAESLLLLLGIIGALLFACGNASAQTAPSGRLSSAEIKDILRSNITASQTPGSGSGCVLRERGANIGTSIVAKPLPHDSRLVIFPYDKNALFPIHTVFNRFTHFEFESGEKILASFINDETEWEQKVAGTGSDILVRPRVRGAIGSMTTITDRRRYQIDLLDVSGCPSESRYQRVSWQMSDSGFYEDTDGLATLRAKGGMTQGLPNPASSATTISSATSEGNADPMTISLTGMNANYLIEGDEELSPTMVLDDGKRTWLKFKDGLALRPALFSVTAEGNAETVEYTPHGSYFIVSKVFTHGILLKLGKREVKIRNKTSSNCGWFSTSCGVNANNVFGG